jgi:hypothetical protein
MERNPEKKHGGEKSGGSEEAPVWAAQRFAAPRRLGDASGTRRQGHWLGGSGLGKCRNEFRSSVGRGHGQNILRSVFVDIGVGD